MVQVKSADAYEDDLEAKLSKMLNRNKVRCRGVLIGLGWLSFGRFL